MRIKTNENYRIEFANPTKNRIIFFKTRPSFGIPFDQFGPVPKDYFFPDPGRLADEHLRLRVNILSFSLTPRTESGRGQPSEWLSRHNKTDPSSPLSSSALPYGFFNVYRLLAECPEEDPPPPAIPSPSESAPLFCQAKRLPSNDWSMRFRWRRNCWGVWDAEQARIKAKQELGLVRFTLCNSHSHSQAAQLISCSL